MRRLSRDGLRSLLFFLPGFAVITFIVIGPLAFLYVIMFFQWNLHDPFQSNPFFVGLQNFVTVLTHDKQYWSSWSLTLFFTAVAVPAEFALGFTLALALNRKIRFERIVKSLILLPLAMAPVAAGALWRVMYSPLYGIIDYTLGLFGIPPQPWIASTGQALFAVELVDIWQWTPFIALILLAGLASLPRQVIEAATLDGAGRLRIFWHMVLPLMRNVILIAVVLRIMDALKTYDVLFSLTGGGPGAATMLITQYLSIPTFRRRQIGLAATETFITTIIIPKIIALFIRLVRERRIIEARI